MNAPTRFRGMGGHHSNRAQSTTWFSPPAIIEALGGADSFDLDPCTHALRPWSTAREHCTQEQDGLALPWVGRVWLNPPYTLALITRFLRRMAEHDHGTALIFARTETDPFFRFVWDRASAVMFLRGRLNFHDAAGARAAANAGAPSVLIAYGDDDRDILAVAPIDGHFVPLRFPKSVLVEALPATWSAALADWFAQRQGPVALSDLYRAFASHPKAAANQHWRAKLRQTLQRGRYERVEKGRWRRIEGIAA